ncbi:MAG: chromosome segregation protein SMC [Verrucomicrobia bacterium]|nr:chromosome segregation protein SMC [Verrucomicrobiota bacterium]
MYLKNLTVLGFKSFADKTSLNFEPGITAIVGPNGCGKSNVSDAVRWVLGEQSAKALRGTEMADVVFNGTDSRKALGMAEVSLTIGDVDEAHLTAAGVELGYNEVTVTRRVFRDGGSEYFINKTACRLRDIQLLFMGTGVGRTSYSIMAQGNITQILSSKPEDRRMVFEEAAGITKFKTQKREALRKLEHTEQNLLRVQDLIKEVKRQIGSLQRQAGKARRYKQLSIELQHLDTQHARHQFDQLQAEVAERNATVARLRIEMETSQSDVLRCEDDVLQLRSRLSELDGEINNSQRRGLELKSESERHESRIQFNDQRLREMLEQNERALSEITQGEERCRVARSELEALTQRLAVSNAAVEKHRNTLQWKRDALQAVENELLSRQEHLRRAQSEAFGAMQQLSRVRNEMNALELQKQGNSIRLEKLSTEKIGLEEERTRLEARLRNFAANVEAEKQRVQSQRGSVEQREARLAELRRELATAAESLDRLLQEQAGARSQLGVLDQLQTSHEGFSAGTLSALRKSRDVLGSLADRIRVPDRLVVAIETALGSNLQLVLTEQPESAQQVLADLATNKAGRASVAALGLGSSSTERSADGTLPANAEPALRAVESDEPVRPLLRALLGRTLVVADLATATTAWRECGGKYDFVTLTGELLNRHGVFTGGYLNGAGSGAAPSSILGRKNQIADLQAKLGAMQQQIDDASRARGALQAEQTLLQASLQQAQTDLRTKEVSVAKQEGEFHSLEDSQRNLQSRIDTVVYEIQNLATLEREGNEKRAALAGQLAEFESREHQCQAAVTSVTTQIEQLRQQRETAAAEVSDTKVLVATEEQLCSSFRGTIPQMEQRIREQGELVLLRKSEIASCIQRKELAESENTDSRAAIDRLRIEREQVSSETAGWMSQKLAQESEISTREESLRELRRLLTDLQTRRGAVDVELAQKDMAVQNLRERIQQKYQVRLDDVRSECITITVAEEGTARVHVMTPEEMAASGAATDWNAVAGQVAALQKRIEEMGPVNIVAIDEYEETEQRHTFLTTQNDDLLSAKAQLHEVINRINSQTTQMFRETFEKIRENFRLMFTEIFDGGKADLHLADEGDLLECGIEIMARPPGKQLTSISLLSGGEQTMTAVALLFAIYQVKPSPFCVLDELDAPLDESNINRFIRILQRFIVHSQFVIITHNKRTIGMADVLYGVTMQERGVSRIVSVKFHKAGAQVTDHRPVALEPLPPKSIEEEEDAPHKRQDTLEIVMAK